MIKNIVKTALGLVGLLIVGSGANAQTTAFNVTTGVASDGYWHVTIVETGNQFSINVTASNPKPITGAGEVQLKFIDTANNTVSAVNNGGAVTGKGQGAWSTVSNGNIMDWKYVPALKFTLQPNGSNFFLGNVTLLLAPGEKVDWAQASVLDGNFKDWTATEQLAPEASSLALLLPGLVPIGIALRRRRKSRA